MYLKTLTLKGFKSFLERTRLSFDPGLSVVVGPNGSGKSNVSDAILWVLGEQSAKTLRGQAMEDVIFAGSAQRHAVGVAEVTLVLDNSDHALPLDFDEVAVTRRMYRSGESEYLLNGAQVRLRDIRDLLYDMGLGRDTYSIISQGRLGEVLQSRPEDRRELIEEAAGIAKHRQRKERAERKLKRLEEDVQRIRDYVRLLKRELRPLERQVDQARAMEELQARRSELETSLAVEDLRELQGQWHEVERRRSEVAADIELAAYRLDEKERELAHLKRLLEEKGLFVGDLEEQRHRSQQALNSSSGALRLLDEKGRHLVDRLSETRRQLAGIEHEAEGLGIDLGASRDELAETEAEWDGAAARLERLELEEASARERASESQRELGAARERVRRAQRASDERTLAESRLSQELANADVADGLYADRIAELDHTVEAERANVEAAEGTLAGLEGREKGIRQAEEAKATERARLQKGLEDARGARSKAESALAQAEAEHRGLERLVAEAEGEDPLQAVLGESAEGAERIVDSLVVPDGLEAAVASYLGDDLLAFAPDTTAGAQALIETALGHLGGSGAGRATVLDDGLVARAGDEDPIVGAANEAVEPFARALFGGFRRVADVDEGRRVVAEGRARGALGEDGSVVLSDGRVRLGAPAAGAGEAIARSRRLKRLSKELPKLRDAAEKAIAALDEAESSLARARDEESALASELSALEAERDAASREVGRAQQTLDRASEDRSRLEAERAEAKAKMGEQRSRLEALAADRESVEGELAEAIRAVPVLEERDQRDRSAHDELRDQLGAQRLTSLRLEERRNALRNRVASLEKRTRTLASQTANFAESARALEVLTRRVEPLHKLVDALHGVALEKARLLQDRSSVAEADSATLKGTVADAEQEVARARERHDASRQAEATVEADGRLVELQVQQAVERVRELGAVDLETALAAEPLRDRRATERELEQVRGRIEALGPVNMVALSQYEEGRERLESVQAELDDLTGAREALGKVSAAIDRKMRSRFLETFDAVNAQFEGVFKTLFGGGEARLEMTDPAHPAETGIEVRVSPPGKRVAKMTLLSGGEQSLTALALLFAVYRTRTVPFYVFDEVEQALDDRNLDKLLRSLDTLKRQTQLIVISHQRRTMEQADVLYGVSMGADGVSRAVSQRLADFRKPETA